LFRDTRGAAEAVPSSTAGRENLKFAVALEYSKTPFVIMLPLFQSCILHSARRLPATRWFSANAQHPLRSLVGFIGLGNMGLPMSVRLCQREIPVLAYDSNPSARDSATLAGLEIATSIADIAAQADCRIIFTMLPTCEAVDAVMTELLQTLSSGHHHHNSSSHSSNDKIPSRIIVDCSTVNPKTSRHWHETWSKHGHAMLDAPVSGGVAGAAAGTLTFMVGCHDPQHVLMAQPYLERMGKGVMVCGGPGSGAAAKLCNNLALAAQMIGICEAMNLGEALGVDPVVLATVMNHSTAKSWSCEVNNPHPVVASAKKEGTGITPPAARDYEGGFATKLMLKDLGLAATAAQEAKVALPLTSASKELYRLAELRGYGDKDFGVLLKFLKGL